MVLVGGMMYLFTLYSIGSIPMSQIKELNPRILCPNVDTISSSQTLNMCQNRRRRPVVTFFSSF